MKNLVAMIALISLSAFATIHEDVHVELNFDHNYHPNEKVNHNYLSVVPESWSFPSRTRLGKSQKAKYEKALEILEEVLNSEEFKFKVLAYKRKSDGKRLYQKNYLWNHSEDKLTNEDVFNILMEGDEKMIPGTEGQMNIYAWVKVCSRGEYIYRRVWCKGVVGETAPSSSKFIKHNWYFYKKYETPQMVNNLVHEWIHLLGFLHGPSATMREEVPYVVGRIAQEVAGNILANK